MDTQSNYKNSTVSGILWKIAERIGAQVVSLIVSIVLARLLSANDYSVVSVVTIFFAFANVLISGGFNTALIQKKDADIDDYSSVLYVTLIVSTMLYVLLFFTAPYISRIYELPILIPVIRVMGITLIINGFKSVLCAYISSRLQFKKFFFSTIGGTLVSAVVGIVFAVSGFGPWALVAQQMTNSFFDTAILFLTTKVHFSLVLSIKKIKSLFNYGSKMLAASILSVAYDEVSPLIIGIKFAPTDLAFYSKGKSFPNLLNTTLSDTFSAVLFPVMSKIQENNNAVLDYTRKFIKIVSYLIFPTMLGMFAVSDTFVVVLLTEKWLPISIYIKIFCVTYMFNIVQIANLQAIRAIGRSDYILIMEIIKKSMYAVVLLVFIGFSNKPEIIAFAQIINMVIATIVNTFPNRKLIGYGYRYQVVDIMPNLLLAIIMSLIVYCMNYICCNKVVLLGLQIIVGVLVYIIGSIITENENFCYLKNFLLKRKMNI